MGIRNIVGGPTMRLINIIQDLHNKFWFDVISGSDSCQKWFDVNKWKNFYFVTNLWIEYMWISWTALEKILWMYIWVFTFGIFGGLVWTVQERFCARKFVQKYVPLGWKKGLKLQITIFSFQNLKSSILMKKGE